MLPDGAKWCVNCGDVTACAHHPNGVIVRAAGHYRVGYATSENRNPKPISARTRKRAK